MNVSFSFSCVYLILIEFCLLLQICHKGTNIFGFKLEKFSTQLIIIFLLFRLFRFEFENKNFLNESQNYFVFF